MTSKRVKQIIGAGVIVVVICGATFVFTRKPTPAPEQVEQTSVFIDENTKDDSADVVEERTWEEVISSNQDLLRAKTVTYLHSEPFSDADTLIKVPMGAEFNEETTCFIGNEALDFSRVTYEGVTGYIDLLDTEYVDIVDAEVESTEGEAEETDSDGAGVSIVDTNESDEVEETGDTEETPEKADEEAAEPTATPEPTPEVKAEEKEPVQATDNPNVTTKTEAEKQSELQQEALRRLEAAGFTSAEDTVIITDSGEAPFHGDGTKFGDLQ